MLQGDGCAAIGVRHQLTAAAVDQRVKRLARELQTIVGVMNVPDDAYPTLASLRQHREEYLEALGRYQPARVIPKATSTVPTEEQLDELERRIAQRSRHALRDGALIQLLFCTALKPLEIVRLDVCDYLDETGQARPVSVLRACCAHNSKARPLYFVSDRLCTALHLYLDSRVDRSRRQGAPYRGLNPRSVLIHAGSQHANDVAANRADRDVCILHDTLRRIFRYDSAAYLSANSARRYAAYKLMQQGISKENIATALGLHGVDAVRRLLPREAPAMETAMRALRPTHAR